MAFMRDNLPKRRVIVDEMPIEVDENISSSDLILASGNDPSTYSILMADGRGGGQLVSAGRRIKVRDGQRFETSLNGVGG